MSEPIDNLLAALGVEYTPEPGDPSHRTATMPDPSPTTNPDPAHAAGSCDFKEDR